MDPDTLRSFLECPICLTIPHSGKLFTCRQGHNLCSVCFEKLRAPPLCPQGRCQFTKPPARNFAIEAMIEEADLPLPCRNSAHGCRFEGNRVAMTAHLAKCCCTVVICPEDERCEGVHLPSLVEHLQKEHPNVVVLGELKTSSTQKWLLKRNNHMTRTNCNWNTVLTTHDGTPLALRFVKKKGIWISWMWVLDDPEVAEGLTCEIKVGDSKTAELSFRGKVHSVTTTEEQIISSGSCLYLTNDMVAKYFIVGNLSVSSREAGFDAVLPMHYKAFGKGRGLNRKKVIRTSNPR